MVHLHHTSCGYVKVDANIFETEEATATSRAPSLSVVVPSVINLKENKIMLPTIILEICHFKYYITACTSTSQIHFDLLISWKLDCNMTNAH